MTLVRRLLDRAAAAPGDVALVAGDGAELTFGELRRRVLAVRHGLMAAGLRPGERVLFSVRPSPASLVLALGAVAAGGVVVFADPGAGPEMFAARLRLAAPTWSAAESLLYAAGGSAVGRALARRRGLALPDLARLGAARHVRVGPRLPGVPRGALSLGAILRGPAPEPGLDGPPDAPAVVIFTSGTTERPRAVVHTQASLAAALDVLRARLPLGPGDTVHTDQLMLGLPALLVGARWSLPPLGGTPERFARDLAARGATHTFCVPVHLADVLDVRPRLPETLRYVLLGAAPAPAALLRRAVAAAPTAEVLSVYGMTEILPVAVASAAEKLAHTESGAAGDLLGAPLADAALAADGELLLSGPNLCLGYLGEPPLDRLATGDLARLDGGRIVLTGRKKDMLIRGKFNLYPGLYEPAVAALPGVTEAAIVGVPDAATGDERVVLAVTGTADPAELRRRLPGVLDHAALPDEVVVLPELPRSGRSRKLDRALLRELVAGGAA
ncbi:class I adenylate-forming enzyme family protein [Actinomadura atramentaria]|uniref:class I adenylate-forming enzyme family protein n=1 Tax=Actinomadura atramentaria TaxID=1990 RepID=UPI000371C122|nr:class I adenylate-forming enzyme family protein [Actinomadura atramentaria]